MHHICTLYGVGNLRRKQRNVKRGFGGKGSSNFICSLDGWMKIIDARVNENTRERGIPPNGCLEFSLSQQVRIVSPSIHSDGFLMIVMIVMIVVTVMIVMIVVIVMIVRIVMPITLITVCP